MRYKLKRLFVLLSVAMLSALAMASADVFIENARFKLVLGNNARAKSLVIKATGEEMLDLTEDIPTFSVIQGVWGQPPSEVMVFEGCVLFSVT